jgi:transcriptional regulator with XRE-family HTH domain
MGPFCRQRCSKIQEVLRLRHDAGFSYAQIARVCGLSKRVVSKYLSLADARGVGWPLSDDLDESACFAVSRSGCTAGMQLGVVAETADQRKRLRFGSFRNLRRTLSPG